MRKSLGWPITLGVVMIVLLVVLTIGWVVVNVVAGMSLPNPGVYWAVLAVGTTFLVLVLAGVVLYLLLSIKAIRLNQRQSNFIDSVTHELKSPLASLKLYLQTLTLRSVTSEQQSEFHRFMLDDLQRLDSLIDHLLDVARLDHRPPESEAEDVDVAVILAACAESAHRRFNLSAESITLDVQPALVRARVVDLEIVFRNLIDNAVKYAGETPQVAIQSRRVDQHVIVQIADNGPGIPAHLRRKIFGRFVRLGSELERSQTGTGLGLYIVRTLVQRLRGRIHVRARAGNPGTEFEVALPAAIGENVKKTG